MDITVNRYDELLKKEVAYELIKEHLQREETSTGFIDSKTMRLLVDLPVKECSKNEKK